MKSSNHLWLSEIAPCPSAKPLHFPARSLCGFTENERGWIEPKRVIYDHELVLIQDGVYQVDLANERYECAAGTYLIIPPGEWHSCTCLQKGRRWYAHFDWQHVRVSHAETLVMTFYPARPDPTHLRRAPKIVPAGVMHGQISSPAVVFDLMERLNLMLRNVLHHERLASRGVLLELLIRLLDHQARRVGVAHRQEELAHRVREVLDEAMARSAHGLCIRALLEKIGQSYEHLARCFRRQYGLTPLDYVQSIRIERAKSLLRQTDLTIMAVADAVGYEDAVYFSRLFKQHTSMTPGRFRRA